MVELSFSSFTGLSYWIDYSSDLIEPEWHRAAATIKATGTTTTHLVGAADARAGFYRVHMDNEVTP